jgi:hypothetical protein
MSDSDEKLKQLVLRLRRAVIRAELKRGPRDARPAAGR